jgi:phage protein D
MQAIAYTLEIDGAPATPELLSAMVQLEIEDHADMADMLRMQISVAVRDDGAGWSFVDDDLFKRLANIAVKIRIGNDSVALIDAYVIEVQTNFSNDPGSSVLEVIAMDPTVLMSLEEKVRPWPDMADADIASSIFGEYGFSTDVEQTSPSREEVKHTTIQRGTDIAFLKKLAERNGFECFVETDSSGAAAVGHFHKPKLDESSQGVLTVNQGAATNVNQFQGRFDMLKPTTVSVTGLDIEGQEDQPAESDAASLDDLGAKPALAPEERRKVLVSRTGLSDTGELQALTQAMVDKSSWAITGEGELNTSSYGGLLRAKRPVLVRGAGRTFSGSYYVERVHHGFTPEGYVQRFSLRRNALGVTGSEDFAAEAV